MFKVGDKFFCNCGCDFTFTVLGVNTDQEYYNVVNDANKKKDIHMFDNPHMVSMEIYNSPLWKALNEVGNE